MDCVYCQRNVPESKIRFFLRILLCEDCYNVAYGVRSSALRELETLRAQLDKTIQDQLIKRGSLAFTVGFVSTADLEQTWLKNNPRPSTASSLRLPATTVSGPESSNSLLAADSRSETESSPETEP